MAVLEATYIFLFLVTANTYQTATGTLLCTPDAYFPGCKCRGKNFQLDISRILPYPYSISDIRPDLNYSFSPCKPIACQGGSNAAICQYYFSYQYNCGMRANWSVYSINPQNFSIVYSNGTEKRQTTVWFYNDQNATTNRASTLVESPILHYAFSVTFNDYASNLTTTPSASIDPTPQGFQVKIALQIGLTTGLFAALLMGITAVVIIIIIVRRMSRCKQMEGSAGYVPFTPSNEGSIDKNFTLSFRNETYSMTTRSKSQNDQSNIAVDQNIAYGMGERKRMEASYVANQLIYDSARV